MLKDNTGKYFETDANGHILQPWNMKTESGNTRPDKMEDRAATMDERWWTVYGELVSFGRCSIGSRKICFAWW